MATIVTAPESFLSIKRYSTIKVFLAGGITNTPSWQDELIKKFDNIDELIIFNPRRESFDTSKKEETEKQIVWEHENMIRADIVSFWFSSNTLNPITLFELGKCLGMKKLITIGIDPEYERLDDVIIQSQLMGYPGLFYVNLEDLHQDILVKSNLK